MPSGIGANSSTTEDHALGVRLVVIYKCVKAAIACALSLALFIGLAFGISSHAQVWALNFREHVSHAWSTALAESLITSSKHLTIGAVGLALDAGMTAVEAWALHHGHWWGPWLVVVATSTLLPWETAAIVRHPRWFRAALLAVNVLIVVYLTWHALRRRKRAG